MAFLAWLRELPWQLNQIERRLVRVEANQEAIMATQEQVNALAASLGEDAEVIAKGVEALLAANGALQAEVAALREQGTVDLSGVDAAAAQVDAIAGIFAQVADTESPSPTVDEVPEPLPAPAEAPVAEAPVAEAPVDAAEAEPSSSGDVDDEGAEDGVFSEIEVPDDEQR